MSDTEFWFGKHKGKELSEVPSGYLRWMVKKLDPSPRPEDRLNKTAEQVEAMHERMRQFIFSAEDVLYQRSKHVHDDQD